MIELEFGFGADLVVDFRTLCVDFDLNKSIFGPLLVDFVNIEVAFGSIGSIVRLWK